MKNIVLITIALCGLLLLVVGVFYFSTNLEKGFFYLILGIILFAASDLVRRVWRK